MATDPSRSAEDAGATEAGAGAAERPGAAESLLAGLGPEAFRHNAFRVTGLAVDATPREVSRQQDRLRLLDALGRGAAAPRGALDLDPAPDADAVREAIQRLHDPRRRLLDEFFWFWPRESGRSQEDPALAALAQGDVAGAARLWERDERSGDVVAAHNLAVLAHVLLLDLECASPARPRRGLEAPQREERWRHALGRWHRLAAEDGLWRRVDDRIRQLDDPRLTAEVAAELRAELPLGLLAINAQLALRAAERGDVAEVEQQLALLGRWDGCVPGGDVPLAEAATLRAVAPVRERLRIVCGAGRAMLKAGAGVDAAAFERLHEAVQPLLDVLDRLLPEAHAVRVAAHDDAADVLLAAALATTKRKPRWDAVCGMLERTLAAAGSPAGRERVAASLEFAQDHRDQQTCWFCGAAPPDDRSAVTVPMYGEVRREPVPGGTKLHWQPFSVHVPRCRVCRDAHGELDRRGTVGAAVGFLLGMVPTAIVAAGDVWAMAVVGLPCGLGLAAVGFVMGRRRVRERFPAIRSLKTTGDHPQIQRLLARGWAFGTRPKT